MKAIRSIGLGVIALVLGCGLLMPVWAQTHQGNYVGVTQQPLVTHPDQTITASASPTPMPTPVDATKIVYWVCQNMGATNPARVGDASTGAAQGILLPACSANNGCLPVFIPYNGILYAYSAAGTVLGCQEIDLR